MPSINKCPLCGSELTAAKFARVMKEHRGLERQLYKLKTAEDRAKQQLERVKEQAKLLAIRTKAKATRQVEHERRRVADRLRKYQSNTIKLRSEIQDLERRLKLGETAQSEGLLEERALLAFLKTHFPGDRYDHVGRGGDILHHVRTDRGTNVGKIVYEVKRVQHWSSSHVTQCADARISRAAEIAVLVTNRFPAKRQHYFVERGVLVISPLALLPVVYTAREGLLNVHGLRLSADKKKRAIDAVYAYLAGGQYTDQVRRVAQHLSDLEILFHKEVSSHKRVWNDRLKHYRGIASGVAAVNDRLRVLVSPAGPGKKQALLGEARRELPKFAPLGNKD